MSGVPAIAVALALPSAAGWAIAGWLDRREERSLAALAGRLATAVLVGIGLSSLFAFGYLMAGGALGPRYVVLDAAVFAAIVAGVSWAGARRRREPVAAAASGIAPADLVAGFLVVVASRSRSGPS